MTSSVSPDMLALFAAAIGSREGLISSLHTEGTDCYRLLHGAVEGVPGLTVDRYGPVLLVQTWRQPLRPSVVARIADAATAALGASLAPAYRHRGPRVEPEQLDPNDAHARPQDFSPAHPVGHEMGIAYDVRPYHRGLDPLLFVDLRAGRRLVRAEASGRSLLNLFAYTCGLGVCAAVGGAREVVNVDFASSSLDVGMRNAERNGVPRRTFKTIHEDVIPVLRQFAGLHVKGRGARHRSFLRFEPRQFDIVALDPPRWAKGAFGAVDVVRDYPSLFKPAVLATRPGGHVLATNHVPKVSLEDWLDVLTRCALKAGRPLTTIEVIAPEADVPSFDDRPPLKMAWLTVGAES